MPLPLGTATETRLQAKRSDLRGPYPPRFLALGASGVETAERDPEPSPQDPEPSPARLLNSDKGKSTLTRTHGPGGRRKSPGAPS